MNLGIIGLGYWGYNYLRILNELNNVSLKYYCDLDKRKIKKTWIYANNAKITSSYQDILRDSETGIIIITTPPNTHYHIIKDCLEARKDVLVEKPLTLSVEEGEKIVNLARKKNKILMVGHTYLSNPGILKLKSLIDSGKLGDILYGIALRLGLSPIRKSASVLWDLASHDVSIALYLFGIPTSLSCIGESYIQRGIEDYANIVLRYQNKINFSIYTSWFCPEKIRKVTLVGKNKMAVFDDMNKSEMIKVFKKKLNSTLLNNSPTYIDHQNIVKEGTIEIPYIDQSEPLKNQINHFIECVRTRRTPRSDGEHGLKVIKILETAEKSLKNNGKMIKIR